MIHTATLVHDDVLDEAETRRHIPTFHAEWGNKTSILFGDMLFTKAFHLSSMVDRPACELIGLATNRVCSGELRQMCERGNWSLTEEVYFDIIEGKTAALTQVCGELGARYAGSSPEIIASLGEYGRHLGIAFQIADDLLDLVGDPDTVGKTLGTDLAQGKLTLPLILTLKQEQYRQELLAEIKAAVGATVSPEQQTRIPRLLKLSGSLEQTRCVAEFHARRAVECLQVLEPSTAKTMLEQICLWSVQRER
jgi:octaprenyl-diphosphate synthase